MLPFRILFIIIAALIFLLVIVPWWVGTNPAMKSLLENIIPNLEQPERLSMEQGFKAIHVKIEPGSNVKLYEFHPTNEGAFGRKHYSSTTHVAPGGKSDSFFILDKFKADKCTLFTTNFKSDGSSREYIYYISEGAILGSNCNNLEDCLIISSKGCNMEKCSESKRNEYTVCYSKHNLIDYCDSEDNDVVKQNFYGVKGVTTANKCLANEKGCPEIDGKKQCCPLAEYSGQYLYKPAYEIICGFEEGSSEARWYACTGSQAATIEANGAQFKCSNGEWKVKSGSGIYIVDPQIKYQGHIDKDTSLKFTLANEQNEEIKSVSIQAKVTNEDRDCDFDKETKTIDCGDIEARGVCRFNFDNFCWKAKTFDVKVDFTDVDSDALTKKFKIECNNAKTDIEGWQKCKSEEFGYKLGDKIFEGTCGSKYYVATYKYGGTNSVRVEVNEDGKIIKDGESDTHEISVGETKTINNLKITLYSVNPATNIAVIGANCV